MALVGAQLTSLTISREWERGTMELLISTPVKPSEVMIGKLIPYLVLGWIDAAFCLIMAAVWFEGSVPGNNAHAVSHDHTLSRSRTGHRLPHVSSNP